MTGFEEKIRRLEEIVASLETGDCRLNDALTLYEEGVGLARDCADLLDSARQKVVSIRESGARTDA